MARSPSLTWKLRTLFGDSMILAALEQASRRALVVFVVLVHGTQVLEGRLMSRVTWKCSRRTKVPPAPTATTFFNFHQSLGLRARNPLLFL